ncbi:MAG: hypothetical protein RR320_03550, partial [Oscillospiraceae bacterium]
MEIVIQIKCHPGQIAHVLQQGKQREENRHRRQHDGHHPSQHPPNPVDQQIAQPVRDTQQPQSRHQRIGKPEQSRKQQRRGQIRAREGQPEHAGQQQQHDRDSGFSAGEQPVDFLVAQGALAVKAHRIEADSLGGKHQRAHHPIAQRDVVDAVLEQLRPGAGERVGDLGVRSERRAEKPRERACQRFVALQQPQRGPARRERRGQTSGEHRLERRDGAR